MSENLLEELMLSSANEYFFEMAKEIEKTINSNNSIFEVHNQIEQLKDLYSLAELHQECYKSHESQLRADQIILSNKRNILYAEFQKIPSSPKASQKLFSSQKMDQLKKEKYFIEDQLIKYKQNHESIGNTKEQYQIELSRSCKILRMKETEVKNLQVEIDRRVSQKKGVKTFLSKILPDKPRLQKPEFSHPSSFSTGFSIKSSTMESSRGSHSHT